MPILALVVALSPFRRIPGYAGPMTSEQDPQHVNPPTRELSPGIIATALAQSSIEMDLDGNLPWDCRADFNEVTAIGNGQVRIRGEQRSPEGVVTPISVLLTAVIERRS